MKPTVYIETTVVSYLVARPSRDLIVAGHQQRLRSVQEFAVLELVPEVGRLAEEYFSAIAIPERAKADSFHLAFAAWHGLDFLISWNCTHIASGFVRRKVQAINSRWGIASPTICTPEELMEIPND